MLPVFQNGFTNLLFPPAVCKFQRGLVLFLFSVKVLVMVLRSSLLLKTLSNQTQGLLIKNKVIDLDSYLYLSCETPSLCCLCASWTYAPAPWWGLMMSYLSPVSILQLSLCLMHVKYSGNTHWMHSGAEFGVWLLNVLNLDHQDHQITIRWSLWFYLRM